MTTDGMEVVMTTIPDCDVCAMHSKREKACYDGKTVQGPWAYMCENHFQLLGTGLGTGRGQRLILAE